MVIYANLFQKITKIASSPTFLDRFSFCFVLSDRARWGLQKFVHKILKLINYANLCKFIPQKKNHKKCFSFISQPILIWFALSGRAKFGTLNFYTEF